ncbi:MAG: 2-oxoglutarate and iron-dependent oxygenase domain-containing protein [Polyangiales bacterium]
MQQLPVVDVRAFTDGSPSDRAEFVRRFGDALCDLGFVTLDGHGVSPALVQSAFDETARLFDLPDGEKRRWVVPESGGNRGYIPFGKERALGASVSDLKEFWHVGQEGVDDAGRGVYHPNVWPDVSQVAGFREAALGLYAALEGAALSMLEAVALYLELPVDWFSSMARGGNSVLRLIHYPPVPDDAPAGAVRAAAHEDINLITLLVESTTGGLELLTRDGVWLPVHALDGQIVLDAGDMLQRCTNGRIPSTTHRVVNPRGSNTRRYSMPFFTHPRPECVLAPAPGTVTAERPALAAPVTAHEFLTERLRAITT